MDSANRKPQTRWVENTRTPESRIKHYQSAGFIPLKLHEVKLIEISNYTLDKQGQGFFIPPCKQCG